MDERDPSQGQLQVGRSVVTIVLRWFPFAVMAALSLWVATGLPGARKPFFVDFDLSPSALAQSLAKIKHYQATALFFFLGVLAVGPRPASIPFWLAMGLGVAWELAEATGARHTARLADLLPDLIAAGGSVIILLAVRGIVARWRGRMASTGGG